MVALEAPDKTLLQSFNAQYATKCDAPMSVFSEAFADSFLQYLYKYCWEEGNRTSSEFM